MRNDAVLTPACNTRIGIESNNDALDRIAGFAVRHVIGFMARQIDMPN